MDNVIEIFHNVIHRIINDAGEEAAQRRGRRVAVRLCMLASTSSARVRWLSLSKPASVG